MNCPVCSTHVEDSAAMCPHCQSDLEMFHLIVKASEQRQTSKKIISALGVFAAVTAIGWASSGIFSGKTSETVPAEISPEIKVQGEIRNPSDSELIAELTVENAKLRTENGVLNYKFGAVKETPEGNTHAVKPAVVKETHIVKTVSVKPASKEKSSVKESTAESKGTIIHTVRNGDTFWIISRKYFGTGTKYKQIEKDNGMTVKTKLHKGQKIKIVKA